MHVPHLPREIVERILITACTNNNGQIVPIPCVDKGLLKVWQKKHAFEWALLSGHNKILAWLQHVGVCNRWGHRDGSHWATESTKHSRNVAIAALHGNMELVRKLHADRCVTASQAVTVMLAALFGGNTAIIRYIRTMGGNNWYSIHTSIIDAVLYEQCVTFEQILTKITRHIRGNR